MSKSSSQHYLDYWGFERAPFALTPDPQMLYLSKQHRECMLRLQYAIASNKGGALLVSENPGDGKTSVLKRLQADLLAAAENRYRVVFIDHPTLTPNQVLWEILRQLGYGDARGEKIQNLLHLRGTLEEMHERGERVVFILDEAQLLADRPELLQEFRVLLNYTVGDTFLLTFIFSGQAELEGAMKRLPELYQRLPVRYFLHSMDRVDTGRMLEHRLRVAGCRRADLFTESAVNEIYRYSKGVPRVTCTVADLALVVGHSRNVQQLNDREIIMAIRDLDRSTQDGYHYYHFLRSAGAQTPEEEMEIAQAEQQRDRTAADQALERLQSAEEDPVAPHRASPLVDPVAREPVADEEPAPAPENAILARWEEEGGALPEPEPAAAAPEPNSEAPAQVERPAPVIAEIEPEELPPAAPAAATRVHCPVCACSQPAQRSSCRICGAPLQWICPSCQRRNSAQRQRCDGCGQSLAVAVRHSEEALKETITQSAAAPALGFMVTPDFSLKLGEGEKILAVVRGRRRLQKGVSVKARQNAWGTGQRRVSLVVTNHRLHIITRELQARIPFHEIKGVRAGKGRLVLFHSEGSLHLGYPVGNGDCYALMHALIDFLEFQEGRFRL